MGFIEGGKYQSSAAMGSSAQELSCGLLLDSIGYTILKTNRIVFWSDYSDPNKILFLPELTKNQQLAVNIYRQKFSIDCGLFFLVLNSDNELEVIQGSKADYIISLYNAQRYVDTKQENELGKFSLLFDFVKEQFGSKLYQYSVPHDRTKPLYKSKRGSRGKNRGNKK